MDDRIVSHKSKFSSAKYKKSFKTNRIAFKNIKSLLKINTKNTIKLKKIQNFFYYWLRIGWTFCFNIFKFFCIEKL